jgi:hypothetical protein
MRDPDAKMLSRVEITSLVMTTPRWTMDCRINEERFKFLIGDEPYP